MRRSALNLAPLQQPLVNVVRGVVPRRLRPCIELGARHALGRLPAAELDQQLHAQILNRLYRLRLLLGKERQRWGLARRQRWDSQGCYREPQEPDLHCFSLL
jgi:hypothetical protein